MINSSIQQMHVILSGGFICSSRKWNLELQSANGNVVVILIRSTLYVYVFVMQVGGCGLR